MSLTGRGDESRLHEGDARRGSDAAIAGAAAAPRAAKAPRCTGRHGTRNPPPDPALSDAAPKIRKSKSGKRRAAVLIAVHVLIAAHITHWAITGRTISPVEPSESMYTLEQGHVNAGIIFFGVAILMTLVFGRFFCGWGCHVVALQDLCAAFMKKLGVRPQPFRSRLLVWVPVIVALYMFVWPTLKRELVQPLLAGYAPSLVATIGPVAPFPGLSNHLMKENFWETFAPWPVAIPFLLVCGFAAVYLLGAKGFCTYGCPYGAIFAGADRFTPGKIIADLSRCEGCGHCTATCTSNVRVHEEIQIYSKVVSPGCMKCLDCVSVCPNDALSFGFSKPTLFTPALGTRRAVRRYDLTLWEEFLLALIFALVFFATRGAYRLIPMLMALGIAGCVTFVAWKMLALLRGKEVRLHRYLLRRESGVTGTGAIFGAAGGLVLLFTAHTGWNQLEHFLGGHYSDRVRIAKAEVLVPRPAPLDQETDAAARAALRHFDRAAGFTRGGFGLFHDREIDMRLAWLSLVVGDRERGIALLAEIVRSERFQGVLQDELCEDLGKLYFFSGRQHQATQFLAGVAARHPEFTRVRELLVLRYCLVGEFEAAARLYRHWLALHPKDSAARAKLASQVYLTAARPEDAITELEHAIRDDPEIASLHSDLAVAFLACERYDDAIRAMTRAAELAPNEKSYRDHLAELLAVRAARSGPPNEEAKRAE